MPLCPPSPCRHAGCGALTTKGRCDAHRTEQRKLYDHNRGGSTARLYDARWQKARAAHLREHPFCELECKQLGTLTLATVVDHSEPHRGDPVKFWDKSKWQSGCKPCHDRWKQKQERAALATPAPARR